MLKNHADTSKIFDNFLISMYNCFQMKYFKDFLSKIQTQLTDNLVVSIIDMVLVALFIYALFAFLKKNNASRLIKYIILIVLLSIVLSSEALGLKMTGKVLSYATVLITVFVIIIFPQEIRRSLYRISSPKEMQENFNTRFDCTDEEIKATINDIVQAVQNMAKKNVGALLIVATEIVPAHILESGTELDSKVSVQLLESIFNTKAPLHDGAVFIKGNRVLSAGCFLPLSQNYEIEKELGTRHRAAIGMTEAYNVFAIIVSEETGVISTAHKGEIVRYYDSVMLSDILYQIYGLKATAAPNKRKKRSRYNG